MLLLFVLDLCEEVASSRWNGQEESSFSPFAFYDTTRTSEFIEQGAGGFTPKLVRIITLSSFKFKYSYIKRHLCCRNSCTSKSEAIGTHVIIQ